MRRSTPGTILLLALFVFMPGLAVRADKLTEANMTQQDFHDLTEMESSEPGESASTIVKTHDFSDATEQAVKEAKGVRVVKGKEWRSMTPKQRDERVRGLRKTLSKEVELVLEVPSGNVWAIDSKELHKMDDSKTVRIWEGDEVEKLPKSVRRDPATSHSDRSGTSLERVFDRDLVP